MDNTKEFQLMLDRAVESEPLAFKDFDRTKNIQSQLQEMFDNTKYSTFRNYFFFHDWIEDNILDGDYIPKQKYNDWSMEQLWLAFVMWKNYDKVWVNHKWVKQAKENLQEGRI